MLKYRAFIIQCWNTGGVDCDATFDSTLSKLPIKCTLTVFILSTFVNVINRYLYSFRLYFRHGGFTLSILFISVLLTLLPGIIFKPGLTVEWKCMNRRS